MGEKGLFRFIIRIPIFLNLLDPTQRHGKASHNQPRQTPKTDAE